MRISPHVETGIVAGEAVSGNYAHSMVNTPLQRAQRTGSGVRLRATRSAQLGHTAWGPPSIHSRGTTDQRLGRTSTISSWLRGKIMAFFRTSSTASSPAALSTTYHAPRRSGVRPAPVNLAHRLVGGLSAPSTPLARGRTAPRRDAPQRGEVVDVHHPPLQARQAGARQPPQLPVGGLTGQVRERGDQEIGRASCRERV